MATMTDLPAAFEQAQRDVRRSKEAAREAARSLAILRDELRKRGIDIGVKETTSHSPRRHR